MMAENSTSHKFIYDIAIIGGGINGCGLARDAAGRGLSVYLCEQEDLASGTSSWSTKLIHGGLRYLEYFKFRLVREALIEREILWHIAPHIIRPLRFVLPVYAGRRPQWILRLALFLYDHLGGRKLLPPTRTLNLETDDAGKPLKGSTRFAFEYSDCAVDDARLVVLNAMDARDRGAVIETRRKLESAERNGSLWQLGVRSCDGDGTSVIHARCLVNAAGPWVADLLDHKIKSSQKARIRLVQGSHIVVRQLFSHDRAYIFQNNDQRIIFAIPYEQNFTLIGTTDLDYRGDPHHVEATEEEITYLLDAAGNYFKAPLARKDIVWTFSGVRPLYDDGATKAQEATRDYVLKCDDLRGAAPLVSIFGGKITTYRRLAEATLALLSPYLAQAAKHKGWTATAPLPGGDFLATGLNTLIEQMMKTYAHFDRAFLARLCRLYGTRAKLIMGDAITMHDMGQEFGAGLTAREVDYLMRYEWAKTADDILWRRTKLGLLLSASQKAALVDWVNQVNQKRSIS